MAAVPALFLLSHVRAQETPEATPQEAPEEAATLVVVSLPDEVIAVGEEFAVEVLVEDVEHLAGFDFTIEYDADVMSFERMDEIGQLLTTGERREIICSDPIDRESTVAASCDTTDSPVCLGGPVGVSGSGLLGRLVFQAESAGAPVMKLAESTLVLDDVQPCDPDDPVAAEIQHQSENAGVLLVRPGHRVQETPALLAIDIVAAEEPIPAGEEFEARVLVENVEHLAGFQFTIEYDPKRVSFERVEDAGQFLTGGENQNMLCGEPEPRDSKVGVLCNLLGLPFCLGGSPGPSGSGLLGRVIFKSRGGGSTTLKLAEVTLSLDDVQPCGPESTAQEIAEFTSFQISHNREDASVDLIGGGGVSWAVIGPIIGVAAIVLVGGFAGFLWYRRRGARTSE